MRQKRAKSYKKLMHLYCMSFGFRQPFQVLVDSEMCKEAIASKHDLTKQLPVIIQGSVKPMITQCSIHKLYLQGKSVQPAVDLAKSFERRRCNHREAIDEDTCLKDVIGPKNVHRYVLAAQSTTIRQEVRQVPGTPIIHIKRSVIVLEPASEATERAKAATEFAKMGVSKEESATIADGLDAPAEAEKPRPKKKGPKGPNPLSVKKKAAKSDDRRLVQAKPNKGTIQDGAGSKRKRDGDDEDGSDAQPQGSESRQHRHRKRKRRSQSQPQPDRPQVDSGSEQG